MAGPAPVAGNDGRALEYALLASIALHAALLFGLPAQKETLNPPAPPPIQSKLVEEPAPEVHEPVQEPAKPPPVARRVPKAPDPIPAAPPAPAVTQSPAPPAVEAPLAQPLVTAPVTPAPEVVDTRSLGEYRMDLIGAARRYKRYPAAARENNWTGNVLVGVAVGADGRARVSVKAGSGHQVLDQQALDMFNQAARVVAVPAALRGAPFALEVRAIYGLED